MRRIFSIFTGVVCGPKLSTPVKYRIIVLSRHRARGYDGIVSRYAAIPSVIEWPFVPSQELFTRMELIYSDLWHQEVMWSSPDIRFIILLILLQQQYNSAFFSARHQPFNDQ
jgi:hypothetical protein